MCKNHLRTSGSRDNISLDSRVTWQGHRLCRHFQMVIPRDDLAALDSNACIIIIQSTQRDTHDDQWPTDGSQTIKTKNHFFMKDV